MKAKATSRQSRVFVDAIEANVARLLAGEDAFSVPLAALPPGVREGQWLHIAIDFSGGASPSNDLRRKLGRSDPGGPIKL